MDLYWAWRGKGEPDCEPPFPKRVVYTNYGPLGRLADTVFEGHGVGEKPRAVFAEEHVQKRKFYFEMMRKNKKPFDRRL